MKMIRNCFVALLQIVLVALFVTGCGESANKDGKFHLRIAYSPSLCQAPLHVALE